MAIVNLSAPWLSHYRKLWAFFRNDSDVSVVYDGADMSVKIYVDDMDKANALSHVVACEKKFGNVTLTIEVIPGNDVKKLYADTGRQANVLSSDADIWYHIMLGNTAIDDIRNVVFIGGARFVFVLFKPVVVQYYNDDTTDYNGMESTLYEDIARDIFTENPGVYFCTEMKDGRE